MSDISINEMIESFKSNNTNSVNCPKKENYSTFYWPFIESPFFAREEIEQLKDYYAESNIKESYDDYFDLESATILNDARMDEHKKSYSSKILDLQNKISLAQSQDEIDELKQNMVDLGWNPEIEYNAESQVMARKRFISIMNEKMCKINNIDIKSFVENYNEENDIFVESIHSSLHPVSIVLVRGNSPVAGLIGAVTKSDYTHSALALDGDFKRLYSYNFDNNIKLGGGFSLESVEEYPKQNKLAIYTFFINDDNYNKLQNKLQDMLNNIKNTTYSVATFITYPFKNININMPDRMICSQFVDSCMKLINIDITNKTSSKVTPSDLYNSIANKATIYETYIGKVKDFNFNKTKKYLIRLSKKTKDFNESSDFVGSDVPTIVVEAKKIPLEIKDNGDVLLSNPFPNFDSEYMNSHKLLIQYHKSNNIEAMKYELARLYYMNYILEKKLYSNKFLINKEKNMKTRARVLNDFNKYIKIVLKADPTFNFAEYYEQSPFYHNTIEVKGSTINKLKDIINYIL